MSSQALPVSIQTMTSQQGGMMIQYPQVIGLVDARVQQTINQTILQGVNYLIQQQHMQQGTNSFSEMIGTYEIKTNERHILSLSLANYAYAAQHANGLSLMKSLTFNVQTGKSYLLHDLFKQDSNYINVLSKMVEKQIKERDIPTVNGFTKIAPNQDFYVADKTLVLYFQQMEITPHYVGFPMFPIPIYKLADLIPADGLLDRLSAS